MKRRTIVNFHRWLGGLSAIFLLVVSITGLVLNHSGWLGLDDISIRNPLILKQYGMSAGDDITAIQLAGGATLAHLGGRLYLNGEALTTAGPPLGYTENPDFVVVVHSEGFLLLTPSGELIEKIDLGSLPFDEITALGQTPEEVTVVVADGQAWQVDGEWLDYEPYDGDYTVRALPAVSLSPDSTKQLLDGYQGAGVPLYRVILDLHSGRLLGLPGRTLMDLSAVAVIVLVISGLMGWRKRAGNNGRAREVTA